MAMQGGGFAIAVFCGLAVCAGPIAAEEAPAAPPAPLVVLDPGHGGTNAGAPAVRPGVYEKHLTLALAFELRRELEDRGLRVILTRERDEYLTLRQRSEHANRVGADLFVSLHGNATRTHSRRGYETFVLTPEALDVDSRALRGDQGPPRPGVAPSVARLLDDVERGAVHEASVRLAAALQGALRRLRGKDGDRGVRQGSQHVLLGATMPAVLVEVGFVDHPVEGEELLDPDVRGAIAAALADGIAAAAR